MPVNIDPIVVPNPDAGAYLRRWKALGTVQRQLNDFTVKGVVKIATTPNSNYIKGGNLGIVRSNVPLFILLSTLDKNIRRFY